MLKAGEQLPGLRALLATHRGALLATHRGALLATHRSALVAERYYGGAAADQLQRRKARRPGVPGRCLMWATACSGSQAACTATA